MLTPITGSILFRCFIISTFCRSVSAVLHDVSGAIGPVKFESGDQELHSWEERLHGLGSQAYAPSQQEFNDVLVLAGKRTDRPDILNKFRHYKGGWDIRNRHYWASVAFTGAPGFVLAILWFFIFGLVLVTCHWYKRRNEVLRNGSFPFQKICLILLIFFTCAAMIGCVVLSVSQNILYREAIHTLQFVVNQSDYTVQTLRNITEYLFLAKTINVARIPLSFDAINGVERLSADLNSTADTLTRETNKNHRKIAKVFNAGRTSLIIVAAIILVLCVVGFVLSILYYNHTVHIFVVIGWLLVTILFVLSGAFLILDNVISDTCVAMEQWVDHPLASTALSSILPCVDQSTTNKTLVQSKQIVNNIVNLLNTYIYTFANVNPSYGAFNFYNQSGPYIPPLCYPFDSRLQERPCSPMEVPLESATVVWQRYTCTVSSYGSCETEGRITPYIYTQLAVALNESHALDFYTPRLLDFQNCKFARDTFGAVTSRFCPPLKRALKIINAGLVLVSVAVLLCLVLWIPYANRSRRDEVFASQTLPVSNGNGPKVGSPGTE